MSTKPREFYINVTEHSWGYSKDYWSRWQRKSHDIVHVIEHSAYKSLKKKLAVAVEALEKYAHADCHSCAIEYGATKIDAPDFDNETAQEALALIKPDAQKAVPND